MNLTGTTFKEQFENTPNAILLDVRTAGEYMSGTIQKALNIDIMQPDFLNEVNKLDKAATYFVFCRSGNRSGQACLIMEQLGFNAFNLSGGISAWPL